MGILHFPSRRLGTAMSLLLIVAASHESAYGSSFVKPTAGEAPMTIAADGITPDEYQQLQADLHQRLTADMPNVVAGGVGVLLTEAERNELAQPSSQRPLKIGTVRAINPRVVINGLNPNELGTPGAHHSGTLVRLANGSFVWTLRVSSPEAGAIRVHIENMNLPAGAELYFFNLNGEAYGPYTGLGMNGTGEFWTESIFDSQGYLQLYIPANANLQAIRFDVSEIAHISPEFVDYVNIALGSFCGNPSCLEDATCFSVPEVTGAKDAIALMEYVISGDVFTCSGGLVTDTNPSESNFFITANHCLSTNPAAASVEFFWRFRTSTCNGTCPNSGTWVLKNIGSVLKTTNSAQDFTLLRLNANPPAGSVFMGYTSSPVAFSGGTQLYRISNPNFGPQVYSQHNVDTVFGACGGLPRGNFIYSRDITGAIDGGSSGSPVINGSGQIVGQLFGACGSNPGNPCQNGPGEANATVDGAFANYFSQVQQFLEGQAAAITQEPTNQSVCQGSQAMFTVVAGGANPITYQWRKNGVNIMGATSPTLTINNAQPSDAAPYTCFVSNSLGNDTSVVATLTVLNNTTCNDGLYCNGAETCSNGACVDSADPCPQACKESTDTCQPYGTMSCQLASQGAPAGGSTELILQLSQVLDLAGYQAQIAITPISGVGTATVAACPEGIFVDVDRTDYVFFDETSFIATDCANNSVASAIQGQIEVPSSPKYLATYKIEISPDAEAGSMFQIALVNDPLQTFLREGVEMPIPFNIGSPCILTVSDCPSVFGDIKTPLDGQVTIDDILCCLNGFSNFASCPLADLHPCFGNGSISLDDILWTLAAFSGADYCCGSGGGAGVPEPTGELQPISANYEEAKPSPVEPSQLPPLRIELKHAYESRDGANYAIVDVFAHDLQDLRGYELALNQGHATPRATLVELFVDENRADFSFFGLEEFVAADHNRGRLAGALMAGGVSRRAAAYLGTFVYELPVESANSSINLEFSLDSRTQFRNSEGQSITWQVGRKSSKFGGLKAGK